MATKTTNYTTEQEKYLSTVYVPTATEGEREEQIAKAAAHLGKKVASVRAKLTHMGLYVAKAKAPAGKAGEKKAEIVAQIAQLCAVNVEAVESLEKATKKALDVIRGRLESDSTVNLE